MFGESDSESPRAGSPWDSLLLATPPDDIAAVDSTAQRAAYGIPKLIPEVEEGNVEYKLKLINPTEERFVRLVTQLKWRLLEGGGQAYYELGVADSGQLVGLSRLHLEQSLQTLEEMAGEIGASVVVVKEIEVPGCLLDISAKGRNKGPDGAMRMRKLRMGSYTDSTTGGESATTGTDWEGEAELANPSGGDEVDTDEFECDLNRNILKVPSKPFRTASFEFLTSPTSALARSHPDRPTPQDSPAIQAIDSDLGDDADVELDSSDMLMFPFDLAISSVYKPRPTRKRELFALGSQGHTHAHIHAEGINDVASRTTAQTQVSNASERRALRQQKFQKKRRRGKNANFLDAKYTANNDIPTLELVVDSPSPQFPDDISDLIPALKSLHVSVDVQPCDKGYLHSDTHESSSPATDDLEDVDDLERRVMVEVLVVRKMSVEEAFLDFGGFSLVG